MTIPPLDSEAAALALPAVRAIYDAYRDGRAALAEGNAAALRAALSGVELGAYDERIAGWLAGWEPQVVAVVCGWVERAYEAGRAAGGG